MPEDATSIDDVKDTKILSMITSFKQLDSVDRYDYLILMSSLLTQQEISLLASKKSNLNLMNTLPVEISVQIFANLKPKDLAVCSHVNRQWLQLLSENDEVWREVCMNNGYKPIYYWRIKHVRSFNDLRQKSKLNQMILTKSRHYPVWMTPSLYQLRAPWKKVLIENYITQINWKSGRYVVEVVEQKRRLNNTRNDQNHLTICLQVSSSIDSAVSISPTDQEQGAKIWDIRTGDQITSLEGHIGIISCVKFGPNGLVATGGSDQTIRLWSSLNNQCLKIFTGHRGEVECLQFDSDKIVSGSSDHTIKVWDIQSGVCLQTLHGHTDAVTCLQFNDKFLISGSCDQSIRVWDMETFQQELVLEGHQGKVLCLQFQDDLLISGGSDSVINIWNLATGTIKRQLKSHTGDIVTLQFDNQKIVSGSSDNTIKVWNINIGQLLYTLHRHSAPVWNLRFDGTKIFSSSFDEKNLIWNFSGQDVISHDEKVRYGLIDGQD